MELGLRKSFKIVSPGSSLRRRVAFSLAIVRLILVPVILLAVYYLFRMGLIVDLIVSVDAPVARLAEQVSVEMLDARRAERNYFLLRDPEYLKANRESLARVTEALEKIRDLEPGERANCESEATESIRKRFCPIKLHGLSGLSGQRTSFKDGMRTSFASGCQSPRSPFSDTARIRSEPKHRWTEALQAVEECQAGSGSLPGPAFHPPGSEKPPLSRRRLRLRSFRRAGKVAGISVFKKNDICPS